MDASPWIYLNGYPGVGKLTIAKQLQGMIPGSQIIHNHLIIDLCLNLFERASPEYETLRRAVRTEVLNAISTCEKGRKTTYIFTGGHAAHTTIGPTIALQHSDHATTYNIPFISIIIACQEEEHLRRVVSPGRHSKLNNIEVVKEILSEGAPFTFQCEYEMNPLDVTNLSATESAKVIHKFIEECMAKEKLKRTHTL